VEKNQLVHIETLWHEARDEIKRRIEQRDKYSIQMTIALGALVVVSFSSASSPNLRLCIVAVPSVALYFTTLIIYSYRVHTVLTTYLRERIEPRLAEGYGIELDLELENYYKNREVPGIRRWFFLLTLWAATVLSLLYLWFQADLRAELGAALFIMTVLYGLLVITVTFWDLNVPNRLWGKARKDNEGLASRT